MKFISVLLIAIFMTLLVEPSTMAGPAPQAAENLVDFLAKKFGRKAAGGGAILVRRANDVLVKHGAAGGDFLKAAGYKGFDILDAAGARSADVIKLFARRGDESLWVISEPKKLAIFLKHGDSAADALLKHPGIADALIEKYGSQAANALVKVSKQNGQRLALATKEGLLDATPKSRELLSVIERYGDPAMDFVWKNKGSLLVAASLTSFVADPQAYFSGLKSLVVEPVLAPILGGINWTFILGAILLVGFLPFIVRSIARARAVARNATAPKD